MIRLRDSREGLRLSGVSLGSNYRYSFGLGVERTEKTQVALARQSLSVGLKRRRARMMTVPAAAKPDFSMIRSAVSEKCEFRG